MIFVTATDTDVGKTFFASKMFNRMIAAGKYEPEQLAYYKPVQTGLDKDYDFIADNSPGVAIYNSYDFSFPASPHFSAGLENQQIELAKIISDFKEIASRHEYVIVEGAGGLAVPLNTQGELVADIPRKLDLPVILVIRPDLGTINHSLLSIDFAKRRGLSIVALSVGGGRHEESIDPLVNNRDKDALNIIGEMSGIEFLDLDSEQSSSQQFY